MVHGPVNIKKLGNHEVKIMKHFRCTFTEKEKKNGKKRNEIPWLLFSVGMIHVPVNIKKKGHLSYKGRIFLPLFLT